MNGVIYIYIFHDKFYFLFLFFFFFMRSYEIFMGVEIQNYLRLIKLRSKVALNSYLFNLLARCCSRSLPVMYFFRLQPFRISILNYIARGGLLLFPVFCSSRTTNETFHNYAVLSLGQERKRERNNKKITLTLAL